MTVTPNMSVFIPGNGQELFSQAFADGMRNIDAHDHTGGPNNGVQLGTDSILDGAITPEKLSQQILVEDEITTTTDTPSTVSFVEVDEGKLVTLEGILYGHKLDGTAAVGGRFLGTFRRAAGGNVVAVSTPLIEEFTDYSPDSATFNLVANTTDQRVDVQVTGPVATTVNWKTRYYFIRN